MKSISFFPGFRNTSDLWDRLENWLNREITQLILPWHKWYSWISKEFSLKALWNEWVAQVWDTESLVVAHSLSCRPLVVRLWIYDQVRFILLNPAFSPEVAVTNMYNYYNRRSPVEVWDILDNTSLYPWLIGNEVIWDSEQFQSDLQKAVRNKERFKKILDSLKDRCLIFVNPDDKIIGWNQLIKDFWDYTDIHTFSTTQSKWIAKWHIPQLWDIEFAQMNNFIKAV
jgi:hypothetical protein